MSKLALSVALAVVSVAAQAAPVAVGSITVVSGTVSVSGQGFVTKASAGTAIFDGSTVMVSSGARAKLQIGNNCTLVLRDSQYLTINSALSCGQLEASAQQLMSPYQVTQADGTVAPAVGGGAAAGIGPAVGFGTVAAVGTVANVRSARNDDPVSGR
jgi:hypothetical protein